MKTKILFISVALATISLHGSTRVPGANYITKEKTFSSDTNVTANDLYRLNCAGCHGLDKMGNPPQFPALLNIHQKLSRQQILEQIDKGKNQMPSFSFLSQPEKDAIIAFILNEPSQGYFSTAITSHERGKMIFQGNCSSCHQATTHDPLPAGNEMCMMTPEPLAGSTKRFSKKEFENLLAEGPCYMPSFNHFTKDERNDLWKFLKTLEGKGEPESPTMGETCPMMKKMKKGKSKGGCCKMMGMNDTGNPGAEENRMMNSPKNDSDTIYYTCSMHPEIKSAQPGNCPKCGMELIKVDKNNPPEKHKMDGMMCPMMHGMNHGNDNGMKWMKIMGIGMGVMMVVMMTGMIVLFAGR